MRIQYKLNHSSAMNMPIQTHLPFSPALGICVNLYTQIKHIPTNTVETNTLYAPLNLISFVSNNGNNASSPPPNSFPISLCVCLWSVVYQKKTDLTRIYRQEEKVLVQLFRYTGMFLWSVVFHWSLCVWI